MKERTSVKMKDPIKERQSLSKESRMERKRLGRKKISRNKG